MGVLERCRDRDRVICVLGSGNDRDTVICV